MWRTKLHQLGGETLTAEEAGGVGHVEDLQALVGFGTRRRFKLGQARQVDRARSNGVGVLVEKGHLLDQALALGGQVLQALFQDQLLFTVELPAKVFLEGLDARGELVVLGLEFLSQLCDVIVDGQWGHG